ncbi:MAG: AAA family ATPase [Clostridiales bacterium]|nr:AAA family ATPase [Clostridiales bacterium]
MATKILFTSLKGGVGVTTCCIGVGLALAEAGGRTLIVDGDSVCGSALTVAGLANMQVYTLSDYEKGACRAKQTLISHAKSSNLYIMPSVGLSDERVFARAVADVDGLFDYIFLDKVYSAPCDEAVIVTEPYAPSIKCADVSRSYLADSGVRELGLIVCKLSGAQILGGEVMSANQISNLLHLPLRGIIPEDLTLSSGKCRDTTSRAYSLAAENLAGGKRGLPDVTRQFSGLNGYFKRKMRQKI